MKVYLAGSVKKGDKDNRPILSWRETYKEKLKSLKGLEFLDPSFMSKYADNPLFVFGGDCSMIKNSDLVLVCGENKLGIGTSQEILVAKYFKKPVISIVPKKSHHRRYNLSFRGKIIKEWIHPFIFSSSDLIVENVDDAIPWIQEYIQNPNSKKIKNITVIDKGIENFENTKKRLL